MKVLLIGQSWWHMPTVAALGWWRPEDEKFKVILIYVCNISRTCLNYMRHCLKIRKKKRKKEKENEIALEVSPPPKKALSLKLLCPQSFAKNYLVLTA